MGAPFVEIYFENSNRYWNQAQEHLKRKELAKASELAWGSVAEAIKALAATTGHMVKGHREVRSYIKIVSGQLQDPELYEYFKEVERLHVNFYETHLDEDDIRGALSKAHVLLSKLRELIQRDY